MSSSGIPTDGVGAPPITADVVSQQGADEAAEQARTPAGRREPPLVLVAEDEEIAALAIMRGLESHNYRVLGPALTGTEAVKLAEASKPDLAVLDIQLPQLDGLAVADQLQTKLGIPAVILSAHTDPAYLDRARKIGVSGYLVKPVRSEELAVAIDLSLTRFRQMQTLAERVAALEQNLSDRKIIERAKGVLMRTKDVTEEEAYLRIQKISRRSHRKMVDVARSLMEAQDLL